MRHGESTTNKNKIIQGRNRKEGLTKKGNISFRSAVENLDYSIDRILCSNEQRAIESASNAEDIFNLKAQKTDLIQDFDPGILSGLSHEEARKTMPKHYDTWIKRGD